MPRQDSTQRVTGTKVLVIDDEQMIRWSIEQTLRSAGCEVRVAETAAEGMALFRQFHPEVVFLDVRLPDVGGLTLLRSMKEQRPEETAVVLMTAFGETCTAADALGGGADDYLQKPFDFDELAAVVCKALNATRPTSVSDNSK